MRRRIPLATGLLLLATTFACGLADPGNSELQVEGHTLAPRSAAFGYTHYENDGVFFVDQKYYVTWVVVTELDDACGVFTQNARCAGPDAGTPAGPALPDGRIFAISYNSFAHDEGAEVERGGGRLRAQFDVVEDGGTVLTRRAVSGSMGKPHVSQERVWGTFDLRLEGDAGVKGSFSAVRCAAMDELLRRDLYELPRCP